MTSAATGVRTDGASAPIGGVGLCALRGQGEVGRADPADRAVERDRRAIGTRARQGHLGDVGGLAAADHPDEHAGDVDGRQRGVVCRTEREGGGHVRLGQLAVVGIAHRDNDPVRAGPDHGRPELRQHDGRRGGTSARRGRGGQRRDRRPRGRRGGRGGRGSRCRWGSRGGRGSRGCWNSRCGRERGERRGRRLDRLGLESVEAVGEHGRTRSEPDPVAEASFGVHDVRVRRVGHRVAAARLRIDPGVRDAPGPGRRADLVGRAGQAMEAGLVGVDVLLHRRRVVPLWIDRDEDDADLCPGQLERIADVGQRGRTDVRAVGVAEEDHHRPAAQRGQVEGVTVLVGQAQGRRRRGRADGGIPGEGVRRRGDGPQYPPWSPGGAVARVAMEAQAIAPTAIPASAAKLSASTVSKARRVGATGRGDASTVEGVWVAIGPPGRADRPPAGCRRSQKLGVRVAGWRMSSSRPRDAGSAPSRASVDREPSN